jgi:hypothetical protein
MYHRFSERESGSQFSGERGSEELIVLNPNDEDMVMSEGT